MHFEKQKGITIIELIVVLAVFFIIISVSTGIFASITKRQRNILSEQELLNQVNYFVEYLSRRGRMAILDETGNCLGSDYVDNYYLLNNYDSQSGFYQGIKFISDDYVCYEFFLDGDRTIKKVENNLSQDILVSKFEIKYLRFIINGDKNIESASRDDSFRPRITFALDIEIKTSYGKMEKIFQTTFSHRNLKKIYNASPPPPPLPPPPPPPPLPPPPPPNTVNSCQYNVSLGGYYCVNVPGSGNDECAIVQNYTPCSPNPPPPPPFHNICLYDGNNSTGYSCVQVEGLGEDSCSPAGSLCESTEFCGNGTCDGNSCSGNQSQFCSDYQTCFNNNLTPYISPDCPGDEVCCSGGSLPPGYYGENCDTCPADCGACSISGTVEIGTNLRSLYEVMGYAKLAKYIQ